MSKCEVCDGTGRTRKVDIINAKTIESICDVCYGSGRVNEEITADGVYIKPDPGILHFFSYKKDGKFICTIQVVYEMVKAKEFNHIVGKILNMFTREKYRKQGYANVLLTAAKRWNGGRVKFLVTSYPDSSEYSRGWLQRRGFEPDEKKQILIWRRDGKKNENNGNAENGKAGGAQSRSVDKGAGSPSEAGTSGTPNT